MKHINDVQFQNEKYFRVLVQKSKEVVAFLNREGCVTFVSPSVRHVLGYNQDELTAPRAPFSLVHPDDRPEIVSQFGQLLKADRQSITTLCRVLRKDGIYIWIEVTGTNLLSDENFGSIVCIYRDITSQRATEEQLRRSRGQLNVILENVLEGIIVMDKKGRIIYVNEIGARVSGFITAESMNGFTLEDLKTSFEKKIERRSEEGMLIPFENMPDVTVLNGEKYSENIAHYLNRETGRSYWLLRRSSGIMSDSGRERYVVTVISDITTQKELAQRKDDFISMASHELKTPITSMKMYLQLLGKHEKRERDATSIVFVNKIDRQMDKMISLINDLLDISKIQAGKMELRREIFYIEDLIREIVEIMRGQALRHNIIIECQTRGRVRADRVRVGQVLINLLTNAVKYSPKADHVLVSSYEDKGNVRVCVQDFGIGIDKDNLPKIFDKFYRVEGTSERTFPGFGIGLYICNEIIKKHNGIINVESVKDVGSTFSFSLPIVNSNKKLNIKNKKLYGRI